MLPINRENKTAVYLQIVNGIIAAIKSGVLPAGVRLPGSRSLASTLGVNRNTVVRAYEDLTLQQWVEAKPSKGLYISNKIPVVDRRIAKADEAAPMNYIPSQTGFKLKTFSYITIPQNSLKVPLQLNDGLPDTRLAPLDLLAKEYRTVLKRSINHQFLNYNHPQGNIRLRKQLREYLKNSRGINASEDQIIITRGSLMGIHLLMTAIVELGEKVVVGDTNYKSADMSVYHVGGKLVRIKVDDNGLDINALEDVCNHQKIRALYIASHHHHPTTVTLSAERRMHLLKLAEKFKFAIIEDDYDYDFHYTSSPILPLASSDPGGYVSYVGSLSKNICPAFRIGFVVAPQNLVDALCKIRRIIDRQGDFVLEQAMAHLFEEGEILRHLRKSLKVYHERRDIFCDLLASQLNHSVSFKIPEGGLAVWSKFSEKLDIDKTRENALKQGLFFSDGRDYDPNKLDGHKVRLGFASLNQDELKKAVDILCNALIFK